MKLQFLSPRIELKPYINKLWLLESEHALASNKSLIAPNGMPKIMIPYRNSLRTTDNGRTEYCHELDVCFIGVRDVPVVIGSDGGATGSIGIELTMAGAYRFFNIPLREFTNRLFSFADVYGKAGKELVEQMANTEDPYEKTALIQTFLVRCLYESNRSNLIVDHCIGNIVKTKGLIEIKELEKRTGYSKRYLDMLFSEYLGIPPKTLSTIVRFQHFYKPLSEREKADQAMKEIYDAYYDQAHFIKEFKRYTGYSPTQYLKLNNDFGKNF